jgi:hypothetical protein
MFRGRGSRQLILIEAENLGFGLEIRDTVRSAGDRVLEELREICQNWRKSSEIFLTFGDRYQILKSV